MYLAGQDYRTFLIHRLTHTEHQADRMPMALVRFMRADHRTYIDTLTTLSKVTIVSGW